MKGGSAFLGLDLRLYFQHLIDVKGVLQLCVRLYAGLFEFGLKFGEALEDVLGICHRVGGSSFDFGIGPGQPTNIAGVQE